ncbi:hypothetical protein D3C72_2166940 [compost metagenome]
MDLDLKFDARIFQKAVHFLGPDWIQGLIHISALVVVTIFPQNPDSHEILFQIVSTFHMRTCKESQTATVDLKRLVYCEFHGEISCFLGVIWIDAVRHLEVFKIHSYYFF